MKYDVIIIGAGASGLYCAAHLKGLKVLVIEKNSRVGLKILASGSGQCNLTHGGYIRFFLDKYNQKKAFVKPALTGHDNKAVVHYFESHGLACVERPDGKIFPESFAAKDVVQTLMKACSSVEFRCSEPVEACKWCEVEQLFKVKTSQQTVYSDHLVIATGGRSYPALGTTGDGYEMAANFGHTIIQTKPALTGIVTRSKLFSELQGISVEHVSLTCLNTNRTFQGALLFTQFGLSGPVVINNSREMDKGHKIHLNFVGESDTVMDQHFLELVKTQGDKPFSYYYNLIKLPEALKAKLFEDLPFAREMKLSIITKEQRKWIIEKLVKYELEIESLIGYNQAMVTSGGVSTDEIDPKTMASKLKPQLYITGEVMDVDGDTGGYNLQWAFSSGYLAAKTILENKKT